MAACSVATRPSPNEKSRPDAAHVDAFICGTMARDMSLSCNGLALWRRRAQFQLWIFSYHIFARLPKRTLSRVFMQSMRRRVKAPPFFEPLCP
jgi:hypothetical protein